MIVRQANELDARAVVELLNEIIAHGGTTAMRTPLAILEMKEWIASTSIVGCFLVAENTSGVLLGFQTIKPLANQSDDICDIATFTRAGHAQLGIGSALFEKTKQVARALGYSQINATVMTFNKGGRAYYQSRGFEPLAEQRNRVILRFNLL